MVDSTKEPLDWPVPALSPDFSLRVADAFAAELQARARRRRALLAALALLALAGGALALLATRPAPVVEKPACQQLPVRWPRNWLLQPYVDTAAAPAAPPGTTRFRVGPRELDLDVTPWLTVRLHDDGGVTMRESCGRNGSGDSALYSREHGVPVFFADAEIHDAAAMRALAAQLAPGSALDRALFIAEGAVPLVQRLRVDRVERTADPTPPPADAVAFAEVADLYRMLRADPARARAAAEQLCQAKCGEADARWWGLRAPSCAVLCYRYSEAFLARADGAHDVVVADADLAAYQAGWPVR